MEMYTQSEGCMTLTGAVSCEEDQDARLPLNTDDLQCPICVETMQDPFVTNCGHAFCYLCITTHLRHKRNCPSCSSYLTVEHIHPNFLLNKILAKAAVNNANQSSSLADCVHKALLGNNGVLAATDLDGVISLLQGKRAALADQEVNSALHLMLLFLKDARHRRQARLNELRSQVAVLERDLHMATQGSLASLSIPTPRSSHEEPSLTTYGHRHSHDRCSLESSGHAGLQVLGAPVAGLPPQPYHTSRPQSAGQQQQQPLAVCTGGGYSGKLKRGSSDIAGRGVSSLGANNGSYSEGSGRCTSMPGAQGMASLFSAAGNSGLSSPGHWPGSLRGMGAHVHAAQALAMAKPGLGPPVVVMSCRAGWGAGAEAATGAEAAPAGLLRQGIRGQPQQACTQGGDGAQQQAKLHPVACGNAANPGPSTDATQPGTVIRAHPLMDVKEEHASEMRVAEGRAQTLQAPAGRERRRGLHLTSAPVAAPLSGGGTAGASSDAAAITQVTTSAPAPGPAPTPAPRSILDRVALAYSSALYDMGSTRTAQAQQAAPPTAGQHYQQQQTDGQGTGLLSLPSLLPSASTARQMAGSAGQAAAGRSGHGSPPGITPSDALGAERMAKKRRLLSQYEELEGCYLSLKKLSREWAGPGLSGEANSAETSGLPSNDANPTKPPGAAPAPTCSESLLGQVGNLSLSQFSKVLTAVTHYSRLDVLAEVPHAASGGTARMRATQSDGRSGSGMVSNVEFDCEEGLFATSSGQRVYLWDYASVTSRAPHAQAPVCELTSSRAKISSLAFSRHQRPLMAAGDAGGSVTLYDTSTSQVMAQYTAHDRRVWSLDWAPAGGAAEGDAGPHTSSHLFVTGSDDYTVKLWSPQSPTPTLTMDTHANVCSVRFCPWAPHMVAVGSAAHTVLLYDTRRAGGAAPPLATLAGHRKAVSYVRWASAHELVSASTDSTLRLWCIKNMVSADDGDERSEGVGMSDSCGAAGRGQGGNAPACARMYTGHTNERNFVGLSVAGDFIAAGSETNEVFVYYKPISTPSVKYTLPSTPSSTEGRPSSAFICALNWRTSSHTLIAANSKGNLCVLGLQGG